MRPSNITPIDMYSAVLPSSVAPSSLTPAIIAHRPTIVNIAEVAPNKPNKLKEAGTGVPTLEGCSGIAEPSSC